MIYKAIKEIGDKAEAANRMFKFWFGPQLILGKYIHIKYLTYLNIVMYFNLYKAELYNVSCTCANTLSKKKLLKSNKLKATLLSRVFLHFSIDFTRIVVLNFSFISIVCTYVFSVPQSRGCEDADQHVRGEALLLQPVQ